MSYINKNKKKCNFGRELNIEEKKELMLSILDEIDEFCRCNDIQYFLVGGSLLGSIRHNGFIPWDDDIDIGLLREDYDRLLSYFVSNSGNVQIEDYRKNKKHKWANAKAYDKRTILIETGDEKSPTGVFVDIFPFDYVIGDREKAKSKTIQKKRWKDILTVKHLQVDRTRATWKNIIVVCSKILYLIPDGYIIGKINKIETENIGINDVEYICNFTGAWGIKELAPSRCFKSTTEAIFEGRKYKIPIGYDEYLTNVYGEYMTPPPIEKQISHHDSIAYWKE